MHESKCVSFCWFEGKIIQQNFGEKLCIETERLNTLTSLLVQKCNDSKALAIAFNENRKISWESFISCLMAARGYFEIYEYERARNRTRSHKFRFSFSFVFVLRLFSGKTKMNNIKFDGTENFGTVEWWKVQFKLLST